MFDVLSSWTARFQAEGAISPSHVRDFRFGKSSNSEKSEILLAAPFKQKSLI
jgi:hypothetical protein